MIVLVKYGRVVDMTLALRCHRCMGEGQERHAEGICPRCNGSGVRPRGWAYEADDVAVQVGDIVETPRTPRSADGPQFATVVAVDVDPAEYPGEHVRLLRVVESSTAPS